MNKYGIDVFKLEVVRDKIDDIIELGRLERYYIKLYNSNNPNFGYNESAGGESNQ